MSRKRLFVLLLVFLLTAAGVLFVYTRTPAKPQYCWLVFGPQGRTHVWVTVEGRRVRLERVDEWGRLSRDRWFARLDDPADTGIADPDGKTHYVITHISRHKDEVHARVSLMVRVDITGPLAYRQYCDVELVGEPSRAYVAHFNGPLAIGLNTVLWKVSPGVVLRTGNKPTELNAVIGTMDPERGCWVAVRTHTDRFQSAFPSGAFPVVDIEFPPKKPGRPPVKRRYRLDTVC